MLDTLKEILSLVMPSIDPSAITMETRLREDLDFDSLSTMMLALEIEEAFGFKFEEFVMFKTVGDACAYIEAHRQRKG